MSEAPTQSLARTTSQMDLPDWLKSPMQGAVGMAGQQANQAPNALYSQGLQGVGAATQQGSNFDINPAMNQYQGTLNGDYLSGGAGFDAAQQAAANRIIPQVTSAFNSAGRMGGGAGPSELTRQLGDSFAGLYDNERQRQMSALNMSGQMEDLQYQPQQRDLSNALTQMQAGLGEEQRQTGKTDDYLRQLQGVAGNFQGGTKDVPIFSQGGGAAETAGGILAGLGLLNGAKGGLGGALDLAKSAGGVGKGLLDFFGGGGDSFDFSGAGSLGSAANGLFGGAGGAATAGGATTAGAGAWGGAGPAGAGFGAGTPVGAAASGAAPAFGTPGGMLGGAGGAALGAAIPAGIAAYGYNSIQSGNAKDAESFAPIYAAAFSGPPATVNGVQGRSFSHEGTQYLAPMDMQENDGQQRALYDVYNTATGEWGIISPYGFQTDANRAGSYTSGQDQAPVDTAVSGPNIGRPIYDEMGFGRTGLPQDQYGEWLRRTGLNNGPADDMN